MNEEVISYILGFAEKRGLTAASGKAVRERPGSGYFEDLSFACWAVDEILDELTVHPYIPADEALEDFIIKMSCFAATGTRDISRRFAIARDTAKEILIELNQNLF